MNDPEFIASLQRGESAAYQQLLSETQDWVYNTLLGIVQDAAVAEELAQEVYIQVFRSIGTFRGDAKLSTWMYRIAVTKALGWERKQKGLRRWKNWFAGNEGMYRSSFEPFEGNCLTNRLCIGSLLKVKNNITNEKKNVY